MSCIVLMYSLGVLLKASGLNVTCIKIDPYLVWIALA
jgi:CTP synthase (UTP-ammonia lyase)